VALGALVWWLVGTTLQPVENMRLELAEHLLEKRGFADEWKRFKR